MLRCGEMPNLAKDNFGAKTKKKRFRPSACRALQTNQIDIKCIFKWSYVLQIWSIICCKKTVDERFLCFPARIVDNTKLNQTIRTGILNPRPVSMMSMRKNDINRECVEVNLMLKIMSDRAQMSRGLEEKILQQKQPSKSVLIESFSDILTPV